jgi:tetratricopeptide (TPR) repeat protein
MFRRLSTGAIITTLVVATLSQGRPADESWVGKQIIVKNAATKSYLTADGTQPDGPALTDMYYGVRQERLRRVLVRHDGTDVWIDRGDAVLLDEAVAYFTAAINRDAKDVRAYICRGEAWFQREQIDKAHADFDEAVRLDPTNIRPLCLRSRTWLIRGEFEKALADCNDAIRLEPTNADVFCERACVWFGKSDLAMVLADCTEALRHNANCGYAFKLRGAARVVRNDYDKALLDFEEAVRLDPQDSESYVARAFVREEKQEYDKALADLKDAIRLAPLDGRVYSNRAFLLAGCPIARYRDGKRAIESARQACELSAWKTPLFIEGLAAAYAETEDYAAAVKWQQKALESTIGPETGIARERLKLYEAEKPFRIK